MIKGIEFVRNQSSYRYLTKSEEGNRELKCVDYLRSNDHVVELSPLKCGDTKLPHCEFHLLESYFVDLKNISNLNYGK